MKTKILFTLVALILGTSSSYAGVDSSGGAEGISNADVILSAFDDGNFTLDKGNDQLVAIHVKSVSCNKQKNDDNYELSRCSAVDAISGKKYEVTNHPHVLAKVLLSQIKAIPVLSADNAVLFEVKSITCSGEQDKREGNDSTTTCIVDVSFGIQ